MENLNLDYSFLKPDFWADRDVMVTGHTGFKGSWLCLWLAQMGARIHGYSLEAAKGPNGETPLFDLLDVKSDLSSHWEADIRDCDFFTAKWRESEASVLFHLAAQPLVRASYLKPYDTFQVNTQGTVSILEALRSAGRSTAAVMITSDKCYENPEEVWGRRESDHLGGHDPYSASKAAAEIVVASYRKSFFRYSEGWPKISAATARAGNVIGGGDWAEDRLVPDLARAFLGGREAIVRNPRAVRPWQHVLEPLAGYLLLAQRLWEEPGNPLWPSPWNFGPASSDVWPVSRLADCFAASWGGEASWKEVSEHDSPFESSFLHLNTDKALQKLGWRPRFKIDEAVRLTARWYRESAKDRFDARQACLKDISQYLAGNPRGGLG
jgi:CDP-glucose 4,6-dehydratase